MVFALQGCGDGLGRRVKLAFCRQGEGMATRHSTPGRHNESPALVDWPGGFAQHRESGHKRLLCKSWLDLFSRTNASHSHLDYDLIFI